MQLKNLVLGLALLTATSVQGAVYKCAEKADEALKKGRLQYSVILTELEAITDPKIVKDNDYAKKIRVSVLSRDPEAGGKFTLDRPTFEAVGTYSDVSFYVDGKKKNGFSFHIYLDELDQSSMSLKGVKEDINMNCHGSDHG